jgi:hypothetical protein
MAKAHKAIGHESYKNMKRKKYKTNWMKKKIIKAKNITQLNKGKCVEQK